MNTASSKRFVVPGFTESIALDTQRLPKHVQVYLVGGAVRDLCMGLPAKDRDWVVVGATPQELIQAGFTPVGAEFPVFLHPDTKEEYALARTERKAGHGYKGFTFFADPSVTLAQDLTRRDLTINAMAIDADGQLIDPLGGFDDLQNKVLRHVGPAFSEDPLRVLRLARFAARFDAYRIHPDTMALCHHISISGELGHLVPERIQAELSKGFAEKTPSRMWVLLNEVDAWRAMLHNQLSHHHMEAVVNVFNAISGHSLDALQAADARVSVLWRWCCVLNGMPNEALHTLAKAWRLPAEVPACAFVWGKTNVLLADVAWNQLRPEARLQQLAAYLQSVDVYRKPERLQCILQGLSKLTNLHNMGVFATLQNACVSVQSGAYKRFIADGLQGDDVTPVPAKVALLRMAWLGKL